MAGKDKSGKESPEKIGYSFKKMAKEIRMEFNSRHEDVPTHIGFGIIGDDMFNLQGVIMGPCGTPYEGGIFYLSKKVPADYPFKPPKIKFKTKVYHPNIGMDGRININILGEDWTPALIITKLLLAICAFLADPKPEKKCILNPIWNKYNYKFHCKKAAQWTMSYAMKCNERVFVYFIPHLA